MKGNIVLFPQLWHDLFFISVPPNQQRTTTKIRQRHHQSYRKTTNIIQSTAA
jgi:hypothetical protein